MKNEKENEVNEDSKRNGRSKRSSGKRGRAKFRQPTCESESDGRSERHVKHLSEKSFAGGDVSRETLVEKN